jgi:hypothetical protein
MSVCVRDYYFVRVHPLLGASGLLSRLRRWMPIDGSGMFARRARPDSFVYDGFVQNGFVQNGFVHKGEGEIDGDDNTTF